MAIPKPWYDDFEQYVKDFPHKDQHFYRAYDEQIRSRAYATLIVKGNIGPHGDHLPGGYYWLSIRDGYRNGLLAFLAENYRIFQQGENLVKYERKDKPVEQMVQEEIYHIKENLKLGPINALTLHTVGYTWGR